MALISFGKQEIDELNIENKKLRNEIDELGNSCSNLKKQIEGIIEKYEKLLTENRDLNRIINNPERNSKATVTNLKLIGELKSEGYPYRQIAKKIREATGQDIAYSTVRYLYKKYIENDEQ